MKVMLRVQIPVEKGNEVLRTGKLAETVQEFMQKFKPESAYFGLFEGCRTAYFVVDMKESSQMPAMLEGFFLVLDADIDATPVMSAEELQKGIAAAMDSIKHR